jgi:hypothetical protein
VDAPSAAANLSYAVDPIGGGSRLIAHTVSPSGFSRHAVGASFNG